MGESRKLRIHLLDSDTVVADTLHDVLHQLGHTAVATGSPDELLARLEASMEKIDLVLADLATLGHDATTLMTQVHRRYPDLQFVLMAQRGFSIPPGEALACGVHGYIRKPLQFAELELLLTRLSEYLGEAGGSQPSDRERD